MSSVDADHSRQQRDPRRSDRESPLGEYFFRSTVAALANDLPAPRLEFYVAGARTFTLTAENDEFLLLDFDDVVHDIDRQQSVRGLPELVEDDESLGAQQLVFAAAYKGTFADVSKAIDDVVKFFNNDARADANERSLHAVLGRAVVRADGIEYETERRYYNVQAKGSETMHVLKKQSDRAARLEALGNITLTWLRVFAHRWNESK